MKKSIPILLLTMLATLGCGTAAQYSGKFDDGIYYRKDDNEKAVLIASRNDVNALAEQTRGSEVYLKSGSADTLFIPENRSAKITYQDNATTVTIYEESPAVDLYIGMSPWISSAWAVGYADPWYWGSSWRYRYDPWYRDSWYWGPSRYWGYASPWYWDRWYWDPWYYGPSCYWGWHDPWYWHHPHHYYGYYGWYDPWYAPGWGWGRRQNAYPRGEGIGGTRSDGGSATSSLHRRNPSRATGISAKSGGEAGSSSLRSGSSVRRSSSVSSGRT